MTFFDWAALYIDEIVKKDITNWIEHVWDASAANERERLAKMLEAEGWLAAAVLVRNK